MKHPILFPPVVGLVGGVGSGKSLVAKILQELGCVRIDADEVGHMLLACPEIARAVIGQFGPDIVAPGGAIDRALLAERVFADSGSLSRLNEIIHGPLRAELARRIEELRRARAVIVLDAALLLETDWHRLCDILVYVDAPADQRRRRVAESRGWSSAELARRENFQKSLDKKREKSDYIVGNNSSVSHLREQVRLLYQRLGCPKE
ncbi:MAG: dephospho-CoA kinase [Planctomycetes bacterium]|nr:dephospho-CoA kinase [Planctomycetota bacterium]